MPTPHDAYAEAVALVGGGAYLHGESVLSMHGLALIDPRAIEVATTKRVRRRLPSWVEPVTAPKGERTTHLRLGLAVERVMTDNGPGYRSGEFNELLEAAGTYTRGRSAPGRTERSSA